MEETDTGWSKEWPPSGWYFMRRTGEEIVLDGTIVWVGHNKSGLRWEGQFFYSDHAFCQNREFLGPVSPSDTEQLRRLRTAAEKALDLKWIRDLRLNHRDGCAAITLYDEQCSCGLKDYLAADSELREALQVKAEMKGEQL